MNIRTGIGQDSHRFEGKDSSKPCIIGGVSFEECPGFLANSDGDVVYHAICNAVSSITGVLILGGIADDLCLKDGITDSAAYLKEAKRILGDYKIAHIALSIEAKKPKMLRSFNFMKENIADLLETEVDRIGITATSGEGLTDFGCGEGVQCLCVLTVYKD